MQWRTAKVPEERHLVLSHPSSQVEAHKSLDEIKAEVQSLQRFAIWTIAWSADS